MSTELHRRLPRTWWLTKSGYFWFMVRELTSLAVLAYTVLIIYALFATGETGSFGTFFDFLKSPLSVWLHMVVLVLVLYHTGTWIALTPKVLVLWRDDEQVEPDVVAGLNAIVFMVITGVVLWLVLL